MEALCALDEYIKSAPPVMTCNYSNLSSEKNLKKNPTLGRPAAAHTKYGGSTKVNEGDIFHFFQCSLSLFGTRGSDTIKQNHGRDMRRHLLQLDIQSQSALFILDYCPLATGWLTGPDISLTVSLTMNLPPPLILPPMIFGLRIGAACSGLDSYSNIMSWVVQAAHQD